MKIHCWKMVPWCYSKVAEIRKNIDLFLLLWHDELCFNNSWLKNLLFAQDETEMDMKLICSTDTKSITVKWLLLPFSTFSSHLTATCPGAWENVVLCSLVGYHCHISCQAFHLFPMLIADWSVSENDKSFFWTPTWCGLCCSEIDMHFPAFSPLSDPQWHQWPWGSSTQTGTKLTLNKLKNIMDKWNLSQDPINSSIIMPFISVKASGYIYKYEQLMTWMALLQGQPSVLKRLLVLMLKMMH